ncbi:MAG: zinc-containing alcohol dehydrogenase [Myxococcales bacterium]|nr:zinc-containing alcohol dehydrogenase [Myxococcales bacterium]
MKAVVAERYGGPEVLAIVDRPDPEVGPRDVLIAVKAASLNPLDFKIREGKVKLVLKLKPPIALGCDVAGVVERVGAEVTKFRPGDEVFARLEKDRMGGLAERVAATEQVVARKPARASFEEAAAIPLAGLTALQALREAAGLTPGQRVLIHAGAGGVGSLAIQIAKVLGLHVTTTTSTKNIDLVKQLGADAIVDYTKHEPLPDGLDAVFDTLGAASELASLGAVKRGGIVVGVGGLPDGAFAKARLPGFARPVIWLATGKRRRAANRAGARFAYLFMRPDGEQLAELASWIDDGRLKPLVHRSYPLAESRQAFAELERGRARGKIIVTI